jgi:hypothetical protein
MLVYLWHCDRCGTRLGERERVQYRSHYEPCGNERFFRRALGRHEPHFERSNARYLIVGR